MGKPTGMRTSTVRVLSVSILALLLLIGGYLACQLVFDKQDEDDDVARANVRFARELWLGEIGFLPMAFFVGGLAFITYLALGALRQAMLLEINVRNDMTLMNQQLSSVTNDIAAISKSFK